VNQHNHRPPLYYGVQSTRALISNSELFSELIQKHKCLMSAELTQISMQEYAQSINAVSGEIIAGPNGDFISFKHADDTKSTLPIGNRSQGMNKPSQLDVLMLPDGGKVATVNQYVGQGVESF